MLKSLKCATQDGTLTNDCAIGYSLPSLQTEFYCQG